jgi:hypothetical protein
MKLRTEAYPHDLNGAVRCGVCGADHAVDCASVRMVFGEIVIADDICDRCLAEPRASATRALKARADYCRRRAYECDGVSVRAAVDAGCYEDEIPPTEQAAENPVGVWASQADLDTAAREAKDYLEYYLGRPERPEGFVIRADALQPDGLPF